MKKLIFAVLILSFSLGTTAQEIDLGIKLGANYSTVKEMANLKHKTGWVGGAFLSVKVHRFAIQPEVLFSQQGAKLDSGKFNLDYLTVPIMFKWYLINNVIHIHAGPQLGFITHSDIRIGETIKSKDFDLSGAVGLGLDLPAGLRLDLRYGHSLTDVTEQKIGKNSVFTLSLGFSFL